MRKLWKGAVLLAGAVALCLFGNEQQAYAAGNSTMLPDTSILVDYEYEEIEVDAGNNTVIYYSDNPNALTWEEAEVDANGKAVFDISWVKPKLTTRVYVKGDKDSIVTARYIEAQEKLTAEFVGDISAADVVDIDLWKDVYKNYKAFNSETGYILFFLRNGGTETAYFDVDTIEWRKGETGNWQSFDKLNLAQMNAKGAPLHFRVKAQNDKVSGNAVTFGKRYSSEAKVYLQKVAMAPTVTVNNATMSVSIRNGMEFSLNDKDWNLVPTYAKSATGSDMVVPVVDYDILPTTNRRVTTLAIPLVLETDANKKVDKALVDANPGKYHVEKDEGGEVTGIYVYVRTAAAERKSASKTEKILIPFTKSDPDITDHVQITYQNTKSGTSGVILTNKTSTLDGINYQYAIVDDPDNLTGEELSEVKWSTLKAGKTLKVSSSKALTGKYFIFRVAAESKEELPSVYQKYPYQILYDKVAYAAISNTSLYPGGVITAVTSNNAISGPITYTWERSDKANGTYTEITSGTGYANSKYTIKESDIGYYIRVRISNTSSVTGETASVTSKNSGKIVKDPTKPTPTPTPSPTPSPSPTP
ncbi:MAG: hypothetical protein IJZ55_00290 [Lachnospiraceae bacterium]|nr:hypothetical protein [Lachnospiraceae bacterium]